MRYDVFVSYARADSALLRPLVEELRRRGYRVFFDVESIVVGEKWKERLERSLRASRVLVLCWSENARKSEYVNFEYSRAEGLRKPVLPWLLDKTPLPAMMEVQAITVADGTEAATFLAPKLGWTLGRRRTLGALGALLLLCAVGLFGLYFYKPPPAWEFRGEITDRQTRLPISGVEVVVQTGSGDSRYHGYTDGQGVYTLRLPQPEPRNIHVLFRKEGYEAEAANVSTNKPFDTDMVKLNNAKGEK